MHALGQVQSIEGHPILLLLHQILEFLKSLNYERIRDLLLHAPHYYIQWWKKLFHDSPEHVYIETFLVVFIIWLLFIRKTIDPKKELDKTPKLSKKEIDWLIETWQPEPLVPMISPKRQLVADVSSVIEGIQGNVLTLRGVSKPVLSVSSFDYFGFSNDDRIKEVSKKALLKYGCGSCGPRGFYGTIDQHLMLEQRFAKFIGADEAILYSDSASALSSAIPAFSKKGDLLIVDEACCEPILCGAMLSRSTIQYFKHNDMEDLESILSAIAKEDKRLGVDTTQQRRFIVVEGVYRNTGEILNLTELLRIKKKYFYRVFLDESLSFGSLGQNGHGLTEYYNADPNDIDFNIISLDTAIGSIGGMCAGSKEIVDHQRLCGAGYCFSASSPPFLSAAAIESLNIMENNPKIFLQFRENTKLLNYSLQELSKDGLIFLSSQTELVSPVIHLVLKKELLSMKSEMEAEIILALANECIKRGVGVSASRFSVLKTDHIKDTELRPSIRICSSLMLTPKDVKQVVKTMHTSFISIKKQFKL